MAVIYSSPKAYLGWATQSVLYTPTGSPSINLPIIRNGTSCKWVKNPSIVDEATGDYFTEVDSIAQQPHSEITIAMRFRPSQLNAFLAACCLVTGSGGLVPPVLSTFFHGLGLDQNVYADCTFAGGTIDIPAQGDVLLNTKFMGLSPPVPSAYVAPTVLAYERPYQHFELQPATLVNSTGVTRFDTVQIQIVCDIVLEYLTRGDGVNGASDATLQKLGAAINFKRAYNSATEKTAFLNDCGVRGPIAFTLATTCGATHSHAFSIPAGEYTTMDHDHPDNSYVGEMMTARAMRNTVGAPQPLLMTAA